MPLAKLWLKQHDTAERGLANDLATYFADQARRVAGAIADFDTPTAADVGQVFSEADEHEALLLVVKPHLYQQLQVGTLTEIDRVNSGKAARLWQKRIIIDGQQEFSFATRMPDRLIDAIQAFVTGLTEQPYWQDIQRASAGRIGSVITEGLQDGLNGHQMAKQIRESLGGEASKVRARAIARTETTGAMNSGHLIGMEDLAKDGLIEGKTWLAITDSDVRESHAQLNEVTVAVGEDFSVGGSLAPYPGSASLPPEERINCRCTIISKVT